MSRRLLLPAAIVILYVAPFAASWTAMNFSRIPPHFTSDTYFYLVLAEIDVHAAGGQTVNPWYHTPVRRNSIPYLVFARGLTLFGWMAKSLGPAGALLVWNALLTIAIFFSARALIAAIVEDRFTSAFVTAFMLIDIAWLHVIASNVMHPGANVPQLIVPFLRPFFPQTAVPLLCLYLLLQVKALRTASWAAWAGMIAMQFVALVTFPYAVVLMAGSSLAALPAILRSDRRSRLIAQWVVTGAISAIADAVIVSSSATAGGLLLAIDAPRLVSLITRPSLLIIVALSVAAILAIPERAVAWTIGGAGLAMAASYAFDGLLNPTLLITTHVLYFLHTVLALLVIGLFSRIAARVPQWAGIAIIVASLCFGAIAAVDVHRRNAASNIARASAARIVEQATSADLVIASSDMNSEEGAWVPLVNNAEVLFSRYAELALDPSDTDLALGRFAAQMFLMGETPETLAAKGHPAADRYFHAYLLGFRRVAYLGGSQRERTIRDLTRALAAQLPSVDASVTASYDRVFVIDARGAFSPPRLAEIMTIEETRTIGGWTVRIGRPRSRS